MGLNGKGTTGNSSTCSRTLVYREKRSDNIPSFAVKGIFLLSQPSRFIWASIWLFGFWFASNSFLLLPLQALVLDQGLEDDILVDIQKYLEDLINSGLRQRLISLIKVCTVLLYCFVPSRKIMI